MIGYDMDSHVDEVKEESSLEQHNWSPSLDQEDKKPPQFKEEQEEAEITPIIVKFEDNDEKPQFSELCTIKTENRDHEEQEPDQHLESDSKDKVLESSEVNLSYKNWENGEQLPVLNFEQNNTVPEDYTKCQSGEEDYSCTECGKTFYQRSDLMKHGRIHEVSKPFSCPVCEAAFVWKSRLKHHMMRHSGEKPFTQRRRDGSRWAPRDVLKEWTKNTAAISQVNMEEKLIVAVCGKPIIYDQSSPFYRDRNRKDIAWKKISEEVGVSETLCRKRWKTLHDTYAKETKKERDRQRSGAGADSTPKWKYMSVLSFLRPFVTPKETSSNMPTRSQEEQAAGYDDQADEPDLGDESEAEQSAIDFTSSETSVEPNLSTPSSEQAGPSSAVPSARPHQKRLQTRSTTPQPTPFERNLMDLMMATTMSSQPPAPPPPLNHKQCFLLGLYPLLKKVPENNREFVKFQIYKLLYDNMEVTLDLQSSSQNLKDT